MRLALSNLALPPGTPLAALARTGLQGLEVAPTRIAGNPADPWPELTSARLASYRTEAQDAGLEIPSLQALLYGTTGLHLLADEPAFHALAEHLRHVAAMGAELGATLGVFGAPRNRRRDTLTEAQAWSLARHRLTRLGDIMREHGFALALEPVPPLYGADFLTRADDVIRLVAELGHPAITTHLDTACVLLAGDDIAQAITQAAAARGLAHFHIAEPHLGPFATPQSHHQAAAAALQASGYQGWLAIEMLEQPSPIEAVHQAITYAIATYGGSART